MAKVGIVMGSDSDLPVMAKAADILEELGISYEMTIISAHREPDVFFSYAKSAEEKGFEVIIAGAGDVCGNFPAAGDWRSDVHDLSWRKGLSVFDRSDADRDSGGYGGN